MIQKDNQSSVLIIDDMEKHARTLARTLIQHGYRADVAINSSVAWKMLESASWSVVLLDVRLGEEDGVDVLRKMAQHYPGLPVVMITAFGMVRGAVDALKLGAVDYLEKPLRMDVLLKTLDAYTKRKKNEFESKFITCDPAVGEIFSTIARIAPTDIPVLICGESGTGKELLAEAIHSASDRKGKQMIRANCAALPETLVDNELFGHDKGSYTGADSGHAGLFERAGGSSLFLDEIGDMSLPTQSRILRAIQNREIWRIGGSKPIAIDARFICATNRDVESLIGMGLFRHDLYYRLNACTFVIPPLRDRKGDIELLCRHFAAEFSPPGRRLTPSADALAILTAYSWPGNVRELRNSMQYAASLASEETIEAGALPEKLRRRDEQKEFDLGQDEKKLIMTALRSNSYSRQKTADSLRINRATLYRKMRKYGII